MEERKRLSGSHVGKKSTEVPMSSFAAVFIGTRLSCPFLADGKLESVVELCRMCLFPTSIMCRTAAVYPETHTQVYSHRHRKSPPPLEKNAAVTTIQTFLHQCVTSV